MPKISQFNAASTPLSGGETLVLNQRGKTYNTTLSTIKNYNNIHTHTTSDITDASSTPVYNESTELFEEVAALYNEDGELNATGFITEGGAFYSFNGGDFMSVALSQSPFNWKIGSKQFRINQPVGNGGQYNMPDGQGTFALTLSSDGSIPIAGVTNLQSTLNGKANTPTGPWANDLVAAGCPYATLHGHLFVYGVPGVLEEEISIGLNPVVSPNFTPRVESVAGGSIVYYTPDESTYQDIIDLLADDNSVIIPQFPEWLLSQTVPEFDDTLSVYFTGGSTTPYVNIGSFYYTADGTVKRRMA